MLYLIYPQPYGSGFSVNVKCEFLRFVVSVPSLLTLTPALIDALLEGEPARRGLIAAMEQESHDTEAVLRTNTAGDAVG
jgi:hypothetical protein